jgi:selenocysteine-specific elongation factor
LIIATAGHVDHGKTLLVHALTGIDTDRLEEEKARGLTIDLGFAYSDSATGKRLGFIDVPGHIKFINNMLAGVGAVDYALLVIAADDGPMPQTLEHLAILDLLNIRSGVVALTKTDRVSSQRVGEVIQQIHALLDGTSLSGADIFPVSAIDGSGIDVLAKALDTAAGELSARSPEGFFRLAVDRCFTVKGSGVVVTGSVFSGNLAQGDEVFLQPGNLPARVRGLHTQNQPASEAHVGDRCAVNIAGVSKDEIKRGYWLTTNKQHPVTSRFDVDLSVLATENKPLRHWTPVHVHAAAAHATGRIATLESGNIPPGSRGLVQVVTKEPLPLCFGDRIIIRDQGAERTLGGGTVIDPNSPQRGRARPERLALLKGLSGNDKRDVLAHLLGICKQGFLIPQWRSTLNLTSDEFNMLVAAFDARNIDGELLIAKSHFDTLARGFLTNVQKLHQLNRNTTGLSMAQMAKASGVTEPLLLTTLINHVIADSKLVKKAGHFALPGHKGELSTQEQSLWQKVEPHLTRDSTKPPVLHELAKTLGVQPKQLEKVLARCVQIGLVTRPVQNRFFLPEALVELKRVMVGATDINGEITVKQYRDATGIGRNLAIDILEYFDRQGITQRHGDVRKLLKRD